VARAEVKQLRQVGIMARLFKQSDAKRLGLPGRVSLEPVSGTYRIAVDAADRRNPAGKTGRQARGPHLHDGLEECIYVLKAPA